MVDFIGQSIIEGSYVAYPGAGNKKAEYGLILYKVNQIAGDLIRAQRITVQYCDTSITVDDGSITDNKVYHSPYQSRHDYKIWIKVTKSTLTSPMKLVVIPHQKVPLACRLILDGNPQGFHAHSAEQFARWIHGANPIW